jgi:hypothetical protein
MNDGDVGMWIVVDVRSGVPVNVDVFTDKESARIHQKELQTQINPENDEIGLFYVQPNKHSLSVT